MPYTNTVTAEEAYSNLKKKSAEDFNKIVVDNPILALLTKPVASVLQGIKGENIGIVKACLSNLTLSEFKAVKYYIMEGGSYKFHFADELIKVLTLLDTDYMSRSVTKLPIPHMSKIIELLNDIDLVSQKKTLLIDKENRKSINEKNSKEINGKAVDLVGKLIELIKAIQASKPDDTLEQILTQPVNKNMGIIGTWTNMIDSRINALKKDKIFFMKNMKVVFAWQREIGNIKASLVTLKDLSSQYDLSPQFEQQSKKKTGAHRVTEECRVQLNNKAVTLVENIKYLVTDMQKLKQNDDLNKVLTESGEKTRIYNVKKWIETIQSEIVKLKDNKSIFLKNIRVVMAWQKEIAKIEASLVSLKDLSSQYKLSPQFEHQSKKEPVKIIKNQTNSPNKKRKRQDSMENKQDLKKQKTKQANMLEELKKKQANRNRINEINIQGSNDQTKSPNKKRIRQGQDSVEKNQDFKKQKTNQANMLEELLRKKNT